MPPVILVLATVDIAIGTQSFVFSGLLAELAAAAVVTGLGFAGLLAQSTGTTSQIPTSVLILMSAAGLFGAIPIDLSRLGAPTGPAAPVVLAMNGSLVSCGHGLGAICGGLMADAYGLVWLCAGRATSAAAGLGLAVLEPPAHRAALEVQPEMKS